MWKWFQIEAYILVKDFRRAYSSAIKYKYVDDVERILDLATKLDDKSGIIDLCNQWLQANNSNIETEKSINQSYIP